MGSIYRRGDSPNIWIAFKDASGKRRLQSAETNNEDVARALLEEVERQVEAQKRLALKTPGPVTVRDWFLRWRDERVVRLVSAKDQARVMERHVLPLIGDLPIRDVRSQHIEKVVEAAGRTLSSRSVLHVYRGTHLMFRHAVKKGLISASPCVLTVRDGDLPAPRDSDDFDRSQAVFTREEMGALIYTPTLRAEHRMFYALLFFGAMRAGEAVARRWSDIEKADPLDKLHVRDAYNVKAKRFRRGGKTGIHREVPILPELARMLREWSEQGRPEYVAKIDRPWRKKMPVEDFIVPGPRGGVLSQNTTWRWLSDDLETLGLRHRRQHDTRRTFVSLFIADGVRPDIVDLVVWGLDPTIRNRYLTMPWHVVSAEISKFRIPKPPQSPATQSYAPANHT